MEITKSRLVEIKNSSIDEWAAALAKISDAMFLRGVWLHAINDQGSDIFFYRNDIGELCESFSYFDITVDYTREDVLRKVEEVLFIYPEAHLILDDFCGFTAQQILFCARDGAFGAYYELWWNHAESFCSLRNTGLCRQLRYELPLDILSDMDVASFQGVLNGAYPSIMHNTVELPKELIE